LAVPRIRADYDQLGQVAQRFGAAADAASATLQSLQQNLQVLEGGDWVGEGAKAFYQEMGQSVLPSLKRLTNALQSAQQVTQAISREMKQAEAAAAAVFKAVGAAGAAAGFGGVAGAFAGATASASGAGQASEGGGFWSSVGDFFTGVWDEGKDMVGGLWHAATHPLDTVEGLYHGITHPGELWDAFKKPFVEAWESGHPFTAIGRGALFAASLFIGVGEAEAAGKAGELARAAEVADAIRVAKLAESARMAGRFADTVDAAKALGQAARGSDEAAELANYIARQSTHIQDPATRVVLGKWEATGGYIGEAQANGGVWYETATGVYQAAGKEATWETNQAFLQQMMEHGVDKLEFHGLDIDQELLNFDGQAFDAVPARVKEIRYLSENAEKYGYVQQGNSFVRVPGSSLPQTAGRAGVAGQAIHSATNANDQH
jgi:WXG100 family type VII secretion target